jgi:hypothetical protein
MGMQDHDRPAGFIFNGPVDATGAYFVNGSVYHAPQPGGTVAGQQVSYRGSTKLEVCTRLVHDWANLADVLRIPSYARAAFPHGREAQAVWDWLDQRARLGELRSALLEIQRDDLVRELDADVGEPSA